MLSKPTLKTNLTAFVLIRFIFPGPSYTEDLQPPLPQAVTQGTILGRKLHGQGCGFSFFFVINHVVEMLRKKTWYLFQKGP